MDELFHGMVTTDLELRSSGDGRTIYGIAVPWNRYQWIDDSLAEGFQSGAFDHQLRAANRVWFAREHIKLGGHQIGIPTVLRNDAAGLYTELRVSKTPLGDESLELFRDGALRQMSIMFAPIQNRRIVVPADDIAAHPVSGTRSVASGNVTVAMRTKANLREIALVREGAYGDMAAGAGVRSVDSGTSDGGVYTTPNLDAAQQILNRIRAGVH